VRGTQTGRLAARKATNASLLGGRSFKVASDLPIGNSEEPILRVLATGTRRDFRSLPKTSEVCVQAFSAKSARQGT